MTTTFREMPCFLLAGGKSNSFEDFQADGDLTRLERTYRRYAALFERVWLVLKRDQAKERYLNYPHVCDDSAEHRPIAGLTAALKQANADAAFVGSTDAADFPLELIVDLVRNYQGEMFLGYRSKDGRQPLFGICSSKLAVRLEALTDQTRESLQALLASEGRLLPLPEGVDAARLGLR